MRKTLLIAAATLAAGVISSQAGVYSQNIVGYVNTPLTQGNHNYFLACPFTIGASNGANEIFGTSLPVGTTVSLWNGTGFTGALFDDTDPNGYGTAVQWYDTGSDSTPVPIPVCAVGQSFLMVPAAPVTNTFAGAVAINVGTSNNMVFAQGNKNYFVGCAVPYGGYVTNGNNSTGGPNLNNLPVGTTVSFWNGTGFSGALFDNTDPNGFGTGTVWYDTGSDSTPVPCPQVTPGYGFLLVPAAPFTWTTGL
jgi:hypothetical protein